MKIENVYIPPNMRHNMEKFTSIELSGLRKFGIVCYCGTKASVELSEYAEPTEELYRCIEKYLKDWQRNHPSYHVPSNQTSTKTNNQDEEARI